jgi:hypothetical protein
MKKTYGTPGIDADVSVISKTVGMLAQPNTDSSVPSRRL